MGSGLGLGTQATAIKPTAPGGREGPWPCSHRRKSVMWRPGGPGRCCRPTSGARRPTAPCDRSPRALTRPEVCADQLRAGRPHPHQSVRPAAQAPSLPTRGSGETHPDGETRLLGPGQARQRDTAHGASRPAEGSDLHATEDNQMSPKKDTWQCPKRAHRPPRPHMAALGVPITNQRQWSCARRSPGKWPGHYQTGARLGGLEAGGLARAPRWLCSPGPDL